MEFKEVINELLEESGLNQIKFAEKLGIKQGHLANWLNGVSKPSYDHLHNICIILNISGDRILCLGDYGI